MKRLCDDAVLCAEPGVDSRPAGRRHSHARRDLCGWRLSCPTCHQLGTWLLGTIEEDLARYIAFHVELVGCRYCQANLADLRAQQDVADQIVVTRRHKYFQSSAGYLKTEGGGKGGGRRAEGGGRK